VSGPAPQVLLASLMADDRPMCGVEHEYEVRAGGHAVDFRQLVDGLGLGRRLDPGDPHAHRGAWGGAITADKHEAEVVTPPVPLSPAAADAVHHWTVRGRRFLEDRLPPGHTLRGYSTHISVTVGDTTVQRTAGLFVRHLAPALMLLLDRRCSPGLLVRPRPGRLELCGEYAAGRTLRHAVAVAVAGVGLCEEAARSRRARRLLPVPLQVRTEPARERFGTYVDRTAFGPDLYADGRHARLRSRTGALSAGEHLAAVVDVLHARLTDLVAPDDLAALHDVVQGRSPLPVETDGEPVDDEPRCVVRPLVLDDRRRGPVTVRLEHATWWLYVFRVDCAGHTRWLSVPRPWLASFLTQLDAGVLDGALAD
jgi:hypothetical protein